MSWQTRYSTSSCRWCGTLTLPPSYAADPAQAIHAANLTDVTSADVNALIPGCFGVAVDGSADHRRGVCSPMIRLATCGASGAATAAFDAFGDHVSVPAIDDGHSVAANVIDQPDESLHAGLDALHDAGVPTVADVEDPSAQLTDGIIDDAPLIGDAVDTDWQSVVDDAHHHLDAGDSGFDIFD